MNVATPPLCQCFQFIFRITAALHLLLWVTNSHAIQATESTLLSKAQASFSEYQMGGGDSVKVQVYQNPDLSFEARLNENGIMNFPLLGPLKLGGLTVRDAEALIEDGLQKGQFLTHPQVMVTVSQVRAHLVNVLGHVQRPGRYALDTPQMRLSDVLAMAGGVTPMGSDQISITGTRKGEKWQVSLNLATILTKNDLHQDIEVVNGDVIFIDRAPVVYVYGQVQKPGPIRLERNMSVLQALGASGGPTLRGSDEGIKVIRLDASGQLKKKISQLEDLVEEGDVLFIRESFF